MTDIYSLKIRWGWLIYALCILSMILLSVFLVFITISIFSVGFIQILLILILGIPILVLNLLCLYLMKPSLYAIFNKNLFQISNKGIKINGTFLSWQKIKSISFKTGRNCKNRAFYYGYLPALQSIFVLDKEGKEYSCVIDIDYFLKPDRKDNNLRKIKGIFIDMNRYSLISDWAEK